MRICDMRLLVLPFLALLVVAGVGCGGDDDSADGPIEQITMELNSGIHRHHFNLPAGTLVDFEFKSDAEVDLKLIDPAGSELDSWEQVVLVDKHSFEAESAGNYKLEIDNTAAESLPTAVTIFMQFIPPEVE